MSLNPLAPFSRYLRPYRRAVVLGLVLLLVSQGISTLIPMVLKWAIDTGTAEINPLPDRRRPGDVASERGRLPSDRDRYRVDREPRPPAPDFPAGTHPQDDRTLHAPRWGLPPWETITGTTTGDLAFYALVVALLAVLQWIVSFGMRWYLGATSRHVERDIREAYVRHIVRLPLSFFQERRVGDLMVLATNDVEAIQRFLYHAFRMTLTGLLAFVMSLALMCTLDWKLAALSLAPMPVMAVATSMVARRIRPGFRRVQEQFATLFYAVLNRRENVLTYVNGGHNYPLLLRGDECIELRTWGRPLGLFNSTAYCEETVRLQQGDLLALYTDGFVDAMDPSEEMFGENLFCQAVRRHRKLGAAEIVSKTEEAVSQFEDSAKERIDDRTLVILKVGT